MKKPDRDVRIY